MEAIEQINTSITKEEVLLIRKKCMFSSSTLNYGLDPIMMIKGDMQYLYDENGNCYLDGMSSSTTITIGHCHDAMKRAVMDQVGLLTHMTQNYLNPSVSRYLLELIRYFPLKLETCFLMNSGSEANDLAILMSKLYTGKTKIISFKDSYHGNLGHAMAVTEMSNWHHPTKLDDDVIFLDPQAGVGSLDGLDFLDSLADVACCIFEPIQGVGGIREISKDYMEKLARIVKESGGLLISDEVQTGFGRTGDSFWGFEYYDFIPDVVTFAKGAGNGYPLAGVVTRREVADVMKSKTHFNTYGGNPVSCNVGYHVLKTIEMENLLVRVKRLGQDIRGRLEVLVSEYPVLLSSVRGRGFMIGLVCNDSKVTRYVVNKARDFGLLLGMSGKSRDVITLKPPYCLSEVDCEYIGVVLELCLVMYLISLIKCPIIEV